MILIAPVAQLDRACGYEPQGREFESLRARQRLYIQSKVFDYYRSMGLVRPCRHRSQKH